MTAMPSTQVVVVYPKLFDIRLSSHPSLHNEGRRLTGALHYWSIAQRLVRVTVVRVTVTGLVVFLFRLLNNKGLGG